MRDAYGGVANLATIVFFMVLVSGYLAFNINYTKAFRVKNKIISAYEEYDGNCTTSSACHKEITNYMKEIGYTVKSMTKSDVVSYYETSVGGSSGSVGTNCTNLSTKNTSNATGKTFCSACPAGKYCAIRVSNKLGEDTYVYYKIITRVKMDIPIINKVMSSFKFFQVSGDTKQMLSK